MLADWEEKERRELRRRERDRARLAQGDEYNSADDSVYVENEFEDYDTEDLYDSEDASVSLSLPLCASNRLIAAGCRVIRRWRQWRQQKPHQEEPKGHVTYQRWARHVHPLQCPQVLGHELEVSKRHHEAKG
jgi:hypothetical protein